ncbi:helix-turn-helix domain-containing protein [Bremerella sp. T1]|uniref:helix-turn-helix domain-containing protein n=1 Tax=Bremerella sp. TYQ1 TaxID=3119568 RepID=UPI001CCC0774|nr:helix-turn-helix domain-containing protein [Bremerella volcania]UBM38619.1 helix-turn-helix domain-containing protein [Bremerella volcania]
MADYLPLSEFAEKLGVSEETIQDLRERGKVRAFRDGSSWKFKEDEVEKAKAVLAEEGLGGSDSESQEFELSGVTDSDEGSSGSMDSLLISDTGEGGDSGSSNIIGDDSDSSLSLDSDIGLGDSSSSSIDPAGESNLSSLDLGEGSDILEGSSINKPVDEDSFSLSDDDEELSLTDDDGSDANIDLGSEPADPEGTGSGLSLGLDDESLDLGTSGIGLDDNDSSGELTLDIEDDEDSSMDLLASDSELGLADEPASKGGSEINLVDDDSGVGLAADSEDDSDFSLSSGDSGLELISDDDAAEVSAVEVEEIEEVEVAESASGAAEDDFLLTPVEGELEDDDSGSQVIALDSDSMSSESGLFGSAALEGDDFGGLGESDGLEADDDSVMAGSGTMAAAAPVAAAPAEVPYSFMNVLSLGITAVLLVACGLMATDLMWNMWSYNEPYALNSTLMDGILSMLP